MKEIILNGSEIQRKVKRMAYQIYEANYKEKGVILAGISGQGYKLAQLLAEQLQEIAELNVEIVELILDKETPHLSEVTLSKELPKIKSTPVIIVDDVLNTGRTLIYSFKPFLDNKVKKMEVAVLVDRSHGKFPVKPNFTGLSLSTTLNDHITVSLSDEMEVYLT